MLCLLDPNQMAYLGKHPPYFRGVFAGNRFIHFGQAKPGKRRLNLFW